jgi:N-acetylmuramoyl-L-alanine amidase
MKPLFIILDSGHGGIVNGKYTTAPAKMHDYGNGNIAYEGVLNRNVKAKLMELLLKEGIAFEDVSRGDYDSPLSMRVLLANDLYEKFHKTHRMLYLSLHSNAGGGTGFEVWTSPGKTLSDQYAQIWCEEIKKDFPEFALRSDKTDGDLDKEEKFYVLMFTHMPAVLGELLFFDNYNDYKYLRDPRFTDRLAKNILNFLIRAKTELL